MDKIDLMIDSVIRSPWKKNDKNSANKKWCSLS